MQGERGEEERRLRGEWMERGARVRREENKNKRERQEEIRKDREERARERREKRGKDIESPGMTLSHAGRSACTVLAS